MIKGRRIKRLKTKNKVQLNGTKVDIIILVCPPILPIPLIRDGTIRMSYYYYSMQQ